ncbi:hypothetical protein [Vogesella sp. EB]|uniref:hypothetical protein n=1 Tax=Vogesella sp. EB TaxID=1526735 RepID=UPI0012E06192|nr:hypothetical protein [Vogesella sp. EB]
MHPSRQPRAGQTVRAKDKRRRMSERSEFGGALARAGLAGVSRGVGSPFLCLLSFGEAKESEPPPRGKRHSNSAAQRHIK